MKMCKVLIFAASSALGLMFAGPAEGAITYKYVATPTSSTTGVAPGSTITVNIYLSETLTGGSTSILQSTVENGLAGAGFSINRVTNGLASPSAISAMTFNADAASNQFNGGTSFNLDTVTASSGQLSESTFNDPAGVGVQLGNGNTLNSAVTPSNEIFLGTVTLIAGTTAGTTTFNVGAGTGNFAGNTVTEANVLDMDQNGTTSGNTGNNGSLEPTQSYTGVGSTLSPVTVTVGGATPEPASIGIIGLVSTVGLLARRKRAGI